MLHKTYVFMHRLVLGFISKDGLSSLPSISYPVVHKDMSKVIIKKLQR